MKLRHFLITLAAVFAALVLACLPGCKVKNQDFAKTQEKVDIKMTATHFEQVSIKDTAHFSADTACVDIPLENLLQGKPFTAQTNGTKVTLQYDKSTGNVNAKGITKERDIPVDGSKTTYDTKAADFKGKKKETVKNTITKTDVGTSLQAYFWVAIIIAAIIFLIFRFLNGKFPFSWRF